MPLQEFCQDVILRSANLNDDAKRCNFYNFRLWVVGAISGITDKTLSQDANLINDSILQLAKGTYDVGQLNVLQETIERVICQLTAHDFSVDEKNRICRHTVGYPDHILESLKKLSKEIKNHGERKINPLSDFRLNFFQWILNDHTKNAFCSATQRAGDGAYNHYFERRRAAHIYSEISEYIKTGKNVSALHKFLEFTEQDARFGRSIVNKDFKNTIKQEIARTNLSNYRDELKKEIDSVFGMNKTRKRNKLQEVENILEAIKDNGDISGAVESFKKNATAKKGFQLGFFSIKESRASENVKDIEEAFASQISKKKEDRLMSIFNSI
ncbi:hypothetical protein E3983_05215 [Legionella israelensis]|uniref:Uncharacterized protein n=1 Tax=Legionella israelensis TaxID=454 RepID=A0AAX1EFC4_9GAMM|nr:hypothetical protein [Legionella israelensis]QBR83801.1 hypothetical protein E3983_05215 [Legionella israelensis]